jgi:hypothetical protein
MDKLMKHLEKLEDILQSTQKVALDLDFALRLFKRNNLVKAQISIYGMMGLYGEAVSLALESGELEIAKEYAKKPKDDDELKKKLWL